MKKLLTFTFLIAAMGCFSQPMQVTKTKITVDEAWGVLKTNFAPLSEYLSQQISESELKNDSARVAELIKVKRKMWAAIRDFRNNTVDSTYHDVIVDSLEIMTRINRNTAEIEMLRYKKITCSECDIIVIQSLINKLQNQLNDDTKTTKSWTRANLD